MTSLQHRQLRYGKESELQVVDLWEFPETADKAPSGHDAYWFIYIHGGAWRDPRCLTDTAVPAIDRLLQEEDTGSASSSSPPPIPRSRLAGFASIGYRLSSHPEFPQDKATTPPEAYRHARHPDHLQDVWSGLAVLAADTAHPVASYVARGQYIVYGHSCGAFLTFQLWMGTHAGAVPTAGLRLPPCVVGLEGIYDLRGFVDRGAPFSYGPILEEIAVGAFGADRAAWDAASPGRFDWKTQGGKAPSKRLAVVVYSPEDTLVDGGEIDTMEAALRKAEGQSSFHVVARRDLKGDHDEVWQDGREVARVLALALAEMDRLGL